MFTVLSIAAVVIVAALAPALILVPLGFVIAFVMAVFGVKL